MWGRSAWGLGVWRCAGIGGFQAGPVEHSPADGTGAHLLLQPGNRRVRQLDLGVAQGLSSLLQQTARLGGGVEAGVPDLAESWRQDMLDQASEELDRFQGGGAAELGAEGHPVVRNLQQTGIGDAHPVGVAPEILIMWCTT